MKRNARDGDPLAAGAPPRSRIEIGSGSRRSGRWKVDSIESEEGILGPRLGEDEGVLAKLRFYDVRKKIGGHRQKLRRLFGMAGVVHRMRRRPCSIVTGHLRRRFSRAMVPAGTELVAAVTRLVADSRPGGHLSRGREQQPQSEKTLRHDTKINIPRTPRRRKETTVSQPTPPGRPPPQPVVAAPRLLSDSVAMRGMPRLRRDDARIIAGPTRVSRRYLERDG